MLEFVYKKCSKRRPSTCVPSLARSNAATEMGECPIVLVAYMAVRMCVCVFVCVCVWREEYFQIVLAVHFPKRSVIITCQPVCVSCMQPAETYRQAQISSFCVS
jgi:hypothetical protein